MDRKKLEKIIGIIRENMMVAGVGGFTSSSDPKGPVAGYDPVLKLDLRRHPKKHRSWLKALYKTTKKTDGSSDRQR